MRELRSPDPQATLVRAIVRYLIAHPEAKDTIEGVMRWWLPDGPAEQRREDVEDGLELLVARGWIVKRAIAPARQIYCANRERLVDMRAFAADE